MARTVNDGTLATDKSLPVDRNTVDRNNIKQALPVTLQYLIVNTEPKASSCIPTCVVTGM